jgi:hypothetical protein
VDVAFGGPALAKPNAPQQVVKGQMKALRAIAPTQPDDTLHKVRAPRHAHAPCTEDCTRVCLPSKQASTRSHARGIHRDSDTR